MTDTYLFWGVQIPNHILGDIAVDMFLKEHPEDEPLAEQIAPRARSNLARLRQAPKVRLIDVDEDLRNLNYYDIDEVGAELGLNFVKSNDDIHYLAGHVPLKVTNHNVLTSDIEISQKAIDFYVKYMDEEPEWLPTAVISD